MECTRWHKNQQAYLEVIWKENKTDDVICLHFGVYGNICGHMIPSSEFGPSANLDNCETHFILTCYRVGHLLCKCLIKTYGQIFLRLF